MKENKLNRARAQMHIARNKANQAEQQKRIYREKLATLENEASRLRREITSLQTLNTRLLRTILECRKSLNGTSQNIVQIEQLLMLAELMTDPELIAYRGSIEQDLSTERRRSENLDVAIARTMFTSSHTQNPDHTGAA